MVVRSTVRDGSAKIDVVQSDSSGNPSSRRDGIYISFWCEGCKGIDEDVLELTVSQHKGLSWDGVIHPKRHAKSNFQRLPPKASAASS